MVFEGKYFAGFFAGENGYEFHDDEDDDWKKGYWDGVQQAYTDCPEEFM